MLDDDQRMISLFEDSHKLKRGEASPDLQLREPPMQPTQDARKVTRNKENFVSLQVQVAVEHGYEMFFESYQDVEPLSIKGYCSEA